MIAPGIPEARYMKDLLTDYLGEEAVIVNSEEPGSDEKISIFKNSNKRWIVSVDMISEGVDIPRLRVLIYLPRQSTELHFRQAMGRVVRSLSKDDDSAAHVIMPTHEIFERWARRVKDEMIDAGVDPKKQKNTKKCLICNNECPLTSKECSECDNEFPTRKTNFKPCLNNDCGQLNPVSLEKCQSCGDSFRNQYVISLKQAMVVGGIASGMDLTNEEITRSLEAWEVLEKEIIDESTDDETIAMLQTIRRHHADESLSKLAKVLNKIGLN